MPTWPETQTRILREASQLKPLKALVTVLAIPFFVLGALIGCAWLVCALAWQATWVGMQQARSSLKKQ